MSMGQLGLEPTYMKLYLFYLFFLLGSASVVQMGLTTWAI